MQNKYRAAIIGCGKIGVFFSKPDERNGVLTHAHAYKDHPSIQLAALMDCDINKAKKAGRLWNANAYNDLGKMFTREGIDIVSICTPDETHARILEVCLDFKPKLVFCEKPLATDYNAAKKIVKKYRDAGILLAVNFSRRWNPLINGLKRKIKAGVLGKPLNISCVYTKGILHNGSHLIDILLYLFGDIKDVLPLALRKDWLNEDPTVDVFIRFKNGATAHLLAADERKYSIFDIYIYFEKAGYTLEDFSGRLIEYRINESIKAPGYYELRKAGTKDGGNEKLIIDAVNNLVNALENKEKLKCCGQDALASLRVCRFLADKSRKEKWLGKVSH